MSYSLYLLFWYRPLNLFVYMRTSKRECATRERKNIRILRVLLITLTFLISSSKSVCLHAPVKERTCNKRIKTLVYYVSYLLHLLFWYRPLNLFVYMRTSKRECRGIRFSLLKSKQDWEFFWLRFWNLRYFFVSYVKIS